MRLILLGPPGSGKGTVAARLLNDFPQFSYIYPGDLLRKEAKKNTKRAKMIRSSMERGDMVPNDITIGLIGKQLKKAKHFILDGFPRTWPQVKHLENATKINLLLFLNISEKTALERLTLRRVCPKCKAIYHLRYIKPRQGQRCDKCNTKLTQRADDMPKAVKERFRVYRQQTLPVLRFYKKQGILKTINAEGTPEEVYRRVKKMITEKVPKKQIKPLT